MAVLTFGSISAGAQTTEPPPGIGPGARPHIVLTIVDELGTGDVPWADRSIVAPTILELANSGTVSIHREVPK